MSHTTFRDVQFTQPANVSCPSGANHICQLEGTHRVRSHADDWLHHLANVGSSIQNGLTDPVTLTPKPKSIPLRVYLKVIPYTKFEHFVIIRF